MFRLLNFEYMLREVHYVNTNDSMIAILLQFSCTANSTDAFMCLWGGGKLESLELLVIQSTKGRLLPKKLGSW